MIDAKQVHKSTVSRVVFPLRILLVIVFLGLVVAQVMSFPGEFIHSPESDPWRWPLLIFWELEALCVQVVIVCTWRLLTLVRHDQIFTAGSLRWVDIIAWTVFAAWVLLAAMAGAIISYIYFTPEIRDPGPTLVLLGVTLIAAVFVLLVVVLRDLLRQATRLREDLEGVI
ncbi:DUF2975 domain-containing protein [Enteractinococcus coprophilus]|uniref:DUF2975 family protein n=1 Tax=Enteractinococcus coprophilus TaxID=1027633 RepID=A0A543A0E8_9MICC|nr:DUF2975 domain-containing protein [Enteractinococcus coprophilus]TQL66082.1 DUF2975 family protein [Enteractinococcus coprophilus]